MSAEILEQLKGRLLDLDMDGTIATVKLIVDATGTDIIKKWSSA